MDVFIGWEGGGANESPKKYHFHHLDRLVVWNFFPYICIYIYIDIGNNHPNIEGLKPPTSR